MYLRSTQNYIEQRKKEKNMYYKYQLFYDGTLLTESDPVTEIFDSFDEAKDFAIDQANSFIEYWKEEGAWRGETANDFEMVISMTNLLDDDELIDEE